MVFYLYTFKTISLFVLCVFEYVYIRVDENGGVSQFQENVARTEFS